MKFSPSPENSSSLHSHYRLNQLERSTQRKIHFYSVLKKFCYKFCQACFRTTKNVFKSKRGRKWRRKRKRRRSRGRRWGEWGGSSNTINDFFYPLQANQTIPRGLNAFLPFAPIPRSWKSFLLRRKSPSLLGRSNAPSLFRMFWGRFASCRTLCLTCSL